MRFNLVQLSRILPVICFLCHIYVARAQDEHSLLENYSILKKSNHDTVKIKALIEIGLYHESGDTDTSLYFYYLAERFASARGYYKFSAIALRYSGDFNYMIDESGKAKENYLKSINASETAIEKSVNPAEQRLIKKGMSKTYANLGLAYINTGEYDEALKSNLNSLKIKTELYRTRTGNEETKPLQSSIAQNFNSIGTVFYYQGLYDKAISFYMKSLGVYEQSGEKKGMSQCYNNIGSVYSDLNVYGKAIEYHQKALEIFHDIGDKRKISGSYNNLGNSYSALKDYETALDYYLKSLIIDEELNDRRGISSCLINIGQLYYEKGNYEKALPYYLKSFSISEDMNDKSNQAIALLNVAEINIKLRKLNEAAGQASRCLNIARSIGSLSIQKSAYFNLSVVSDSLGNYKNAYYNFKQYKLISDSIFNEEISRQIKEMEALYQNEKKQKEIELLVKDKRLQSAEIKNQTMQKYAFVTGLLLTFALLFVTYRNFIQKKRANTILARQKQEIEDKNLELNMQNEEISAQRDEIESQRDEITAQRDTVTLQKEHIEKIHNELTDSIRYAKRIQDAVLPSKEKAMPVFSEHFVLFMPKDVVSGDFYWYAERNDWLIVVVADCTGHGVPGAFMSMLGVSFLNEIVSKPDINTASLVLEEMRKNVISSLKQQSEAAIEKTVSENTAGSTETIPVKDVTSQISSSSAVKDGMDLSVVVVNSKTLEMQFAGANNPVYIIRNIENIRRDTPPGISHSVIKDCKKAGNTMDIAVKNTNKPNINMLETPDTTLIELKGDKMPIAIHIKMNAFQNHVFQLMKDDRIYIFSDGYADQFGGPKGRKFMYSSFKKLLIDTSQMPINEQCRVLSEKITEWRTGFGKLFEQTDDITIMGIKI